MDIFNWVALTSSGLFGPANIIYMKIMYIYFFLLF